ncbi:MAG: hypothetical protein EOO42_05670 [Flavobacteriales bacterium]|nr:MAG: hypothetical protein EOO42_05670 [Flavobacteriales bacterium]
MAFIFVFYLVGMMMLPCSDAFNECKPGQSKVELAGDHSHKADANDNCSPFCNCSCCHTVIDAKFLVQKEIITKATYKEAKILFADQRFVSNYYGNIWQPPKLNA